ncbi:biotin synthase [Alphaproteobacteria bacterium]|nr:biotin synthase [Alphaproteobacteria bacterium]
MVAKISFNDAFDIFNRPFFTLLYDAHTIHRDNFDEQLIQISTLLSLKTGGCSEDCAYCAQSAKNGRKAPKQPLVSKETVIEAAKKAKESGSSRFCMSVSGRSPSDEEFAYVCDVIKSVKSLGLETCVTLGFLSQDQVKKLKNAGLDYYNHNVDTSADFYKNIVTTRTLDDRLDTIKMIQDTGINVCSGGIIGMGETNEDRIKMLVMLANLPIPPLSVPINRLVKIPCTPLENAPDVDNFDFIRTIALARILMPTSYVRLSAGRDSMSEEMQALCFFAGANAMFSGEKLLTVPNSPLPKDITMMRKMNLKEAMCA